MTVEEIRTRVALIEASKSDDERAHQLQDRLFEDVLTDIARHAAPTDCPKLAWAALAVLDIEFSRWCA